MATLFSPMPRNPPTPMTKPCTLLPSLLRIRSLMLPILVLSGAYTVWPIRSLARMVLSSCVTIWPVTGAFGASVAFGACGDGAVVCASAGVNPSASSKATALAPVLSVILNLHQWRAQRALWLGNAALGERFCPSRYLPSAPAILAVLTAGCFFLLGC